MRFEFKGRRLAIDFVHANPRERLFQPSQHEIRPGSYRHIVDDVARSLHRRISMCIISEVAGGSTDTSITPITFTPLAYGVAVCHWIDNFKKVAARSHGLERALENLILSNPEFDTMEFYDFINEQFPKEMKYLRDYHLGSQLEKHKHVHPQKTR